MKKKSLTTIQVLVLGFVLLSLTGAVILMEPVSLSGDNKISFVDALFTATSAVTTTGLVVVDTGSFFSTFGQVVILILFQVGGLGYMIFIALLMLGIGKRLSFGNIHLLHESIGRPSSEDLLKFSKKIILFTLLFEIMGAVLFCWYWSRFFSLPEALYTSIFHSVSAFCTAGFSLYSDSFMTYRDSVFFNISVLSLCFAGSVGFFVLNDLYHYGKQIVRKKYPRRFSAHTKLAVSVLVALTILGTIYMYFVLGQTIVQGAKSRAISSLFQMASATTTTGFNTVDIGALNNPVLWLMIVLMFIGACPGGTAGGIKTTTFGLIFLSVRSTLTGKKDVHLFSRKASSEMVLRAFTVATIALIWVGVAMCLLLITEDVLSFQAILFEITSAFGTVGLSTGITSSLSTAGKVIVTLTMLFGRLGPIAVGYSLVGKPKPASFAYPKAEILIG
jgi:trk system potassium uptake protein TrkH